MAERSFARRHRPILGIAMSALALILLPAAGAAAAETTAYAAGPIQIPDGHGTARLTLGVSVPGQLVTQVRPNFRVRHPRTHQLELYLKSPTGTKVKLDDNETRGANFGEGVCDPDPSLLGYLGFDDT
jgi:hypothetical protein